MNKIGAIAILLWCCFQSNDAFGQPQTVEATRAIQKIVGGLLTPFMRGYAESVSGETITYHSANEYVQQALLVRALDGQGKIQWVTQSVPSVLRDSIQTFVWMAGLAGNMGAHRFDMSINGVPTFVFASAADSLQKIMTYEGARGERLTFVVTNIDQFGDLFGYMFLRMPARLLKLGAPVALKVVGSADQSPAWYMTFQYALESKVRMETLPLLVSRGDSALQIIKVGIEHYGMPASFEVYTDPNNRLRTLVQWGVTSIMLPVAAVNQTEVKQVVVELAGRPVKADTLTLHPVHRRTFYLLPHSHTDIGYSDYQVTVERNHMKYIDDAIAIAEKTRSYPEGTQFKWNIEVMWPLESYLRQATEAQKNRFVDAVRKGWIGLNGLYANILTGLCRPEELIHATDFARILKARYGVLTESAMITDIPAYTSSTVSALSLSGIKYFSSGPNYMPTTPDGGDRIGYALRTWGDKPFYWESKSGEHRVLFWMAGRGYSWFHGLNMGKLESASLSTICQYLNELEAKNYPYEMVQVRYTIGGDNGPPDPDLSDCVRKWNAEHLSPRFVIATSDEMFEKFEKQHGKALPVYKGDMTPYWEDGAASTAKEVAMNRNAVEKLVQAQALQAMSDPLRADSSAYYSDWRDIVLFDEHTWGASNSISEPDSPNVKAQWEYKKAFVDNGSKEAEALLEKAEMPLGGQGPAKAVDIVNTNSWPRTDLVVIPARYSIGMNVVRDSKRKILNSQRLTTGELAVFVKDVPALGSERFTLSRGPVGRPLQDLTVGNKRITNGSMSVLIEETTGAIKSLTWHGRELVDTSKGAGLNQYFYVPGRDPGVALTDLITDVSVKERGPLVASLLIESAPAGTNAFRREIRLVKGIDRVDIIDTIDKKSVREKESIHLGFPFLVPGGLVRTDGGWELIRPEIDQLPGSCKDFFSVQRWVDISNSTYGVTWTNQDAPLVEVGEMTNEAPNAQGHREWRRTVQLAQNIYSYAMNNYWHTNYKADQEGIVVLRYSIIPHERFDAAPAERSGIERSQPLLVVSGGKSNKRIQPLFTVQPDEVLVTSLKPSDDKKGYVVRLYNAGQDSVNARLNWAAGKVKVYRSNLFEDRMEEMKPTISMPQSGIVTLKLEIQPEK